MGKFLLDRRVSLGCMSVLLPRAKTIQQLSQPVYPLLSNMLLSGTEIHSLTHQLWGGTFLCLCVDLTYHQDMLLHIMGRKMAVLGSALPSPLLSNSLALAVSCHLFLKTCSCHYSKEAHHPVCHRKGQSYWDCSHRCTTLTWTGLSHTCHRPLRCRHSSQLIFAPVSPCWGDREVVWLFLEKREDMSVYPR